LTAHASISFDPDSPNVTPINTGNGHAYLVKRNHGSFFVDSNGNPFNIKYDGYARYWTTIGNLKGEFTVSQGGAATYRLPIDVVSGPGGITPNVSVNYYSQSGNGLLGKGWSLSASEAITRCKPAGRAASPPNYSDSDTLCLNGDELKVSHTFSGYNVYRKRIDDGTVVHAQPNGFRVYDDTGTEKEFYKKLNKSGSNAIVKTWFLSKVTQLGGASYELDYEINVDDGEALLKEITYGRHAIEFRYEERPDRAFGYDTGGAKFARTKRLKEIEAYGNGNSIGLYSFRYGYNERVDQSYVMSIQKCIGWTCLEPLSFEWNSLANNLFSNTTNRKQISFKYTDGYLLGDVDGNGTADIISYDDDDNGYIGVSKTTFGRHISISGVNGRAAGGDPKWVSLGHADTDGVMDILYLEDQVDTQLRSFRSNGQFAPFNASSEQGIYSGYTTKYTDVNGDGITDQIQYKRTKEDNLFSLVTGTGTGKFTNKTIVSKPNRKHEFLFGDINGDGKTDVLLNDHGDIKIHFGGGTPAKASYRQQPDIEFDIAEYKGAKGAKLDVADINGDGLDDIVFSKIRSADNSVGISNSKRRIHRCAAGSYCGAAVIGSRVYLSEGTSVRIEPIYSIYSERLDNKEVASHKVDDTRYYDYAGVRTSSLHDVNGDGRQDIILPGRGYLKALSNGEFNQAITTSNVRFEKDRSYQFGDLNGDGARDLLITENGDDHDTIYYHQGTESDLRIKTFVDSYRQKTAVIYKTMADPSVYTRATPGWFKNGIGSSINASTFLVAQTTTPEGDTYFKYGGAQNSLSEGYLGFQVFTSMTDRDHSDIDGNVRPRSIVSATYLAQSPLLAGKQVQVFKKTFDGSAQQNQSKVTIEETINQKKGILAAHFNGQPLFSGSLDPLRALNYATANGEFSSTMSLRVAGASANRSASSVHKQHWAAMSLGNGIYRPLLQQSEMFYRDFDQFENVISATNVEYDYEYLPDSKMVRPTTITTTEGTGDYRKETTLTSTAYHGRDTTNPNEMYATLLPETQEISTTALGDWAQQLKNNKLLSSTSYTQHHTYYSSGTSKNMLHTHWITGRESDELKTVYTYSKFGGLTKKSTSRLNGQDARQEHWTRDTIDDTVTAYSNNGLRQETYRRFDPYGQPQQVTVSGGQAEKLVTHYQHDDFGRAIKETKPSGEIITISYHDCTSSNDGCTDNDRYNTFIKTESSTGATTWTYFDKRGLNTKNSRKDFRSNYVSSTTHYDRHQRVDYTTLPVKISSLSSTQTGEKQYQYYNVLDQRVRKTNSAGGVTQEAWDYQGDGVNLRQVAIKVDDLHTRTTTETYNALDQLVDVAMPNGSHIWYLYDLNGNAVRQWYSEAWYNDYSNEANSGTDQDKAHVIEKVYDRRNRLLSETDPDKGTTRYEYTPYGDVRKVINPRAQKGTIAAQTFVYDPLSRKIGETNNDGSSCYFYEGAKTGASVGQLTEVRFYPGKTVNCNGDTKTENYYANEVFVFNNRGLLENHDQFIRGGGHANRSFTYRDDGQIASKSWTGDDGGNLAVQYEYDDYSGRIEKIATLNGARTYLTYSQFDTFGHPSNYKFASSVFVNKTYHPVTGQLTKQTVISGFRDNYLDQTYSYNYAGQLVKFHDNAAINGDSRQAYWGSYAETYHYNDKAHRQLTSVDVSEGGKTIEAQYKYKYDSLGNRHYIQNREPGWRQSRYLLEHDGPHRITKYGNFSYTYEEGNIKSDGRRHFVYGHNQLPTRIVQGKVQTEYVYGADDTLLYRVDRNGSQVTRQNWYFGDMQRTKAGNKVERVYSVADGVTVTVAEGAKAEPKTLYSVGNNVGSTVLTFDT
ncbi:MAG: FG-GAP-like repeat-containing protein, partial [Reinekea sp.]